MDGMGGMDRTRLLDDETAGWVVLRGVLDQIPAERWREPTVIPGGWSVVTTTVHLAAWLDECGRVLEAMAGGTWDPATEPSEAPDYVERVNAEHPARAAAVTPYEAEAAVAAARERARRGFERLGELTPEAWSWFEESGPMHYAEHVHGLAVWLEGTLPPVSTA